MTTPERPDVIDAPSESASAANGAAADAPAGAGSRLRHAAWTSSV